MSARLRTLFASTFVRDSATLASGAVIAQGISILGLPLLSRYYDPAQFGEFALYSGAVAVIAVASTLRYDSIVVLADSDRLAIELTQLCLVAAVTIAAALCAFALVVPASLWISLRLEALRPWAAIAAVNGAAVGALAAISALYNRRRRFREMAVTRIVQSSLMLVGALASAAFGMAGGLMWGLILGTVGGLLAMLAYGAMITGEWKWTTLVLAAKSHLNTPKYLLPNALLDVVTQQLPVYLIVAWFSNDDAGFFSMAWRILMIPSILLGTAVGQVFYQRFAAAWPNRDNAKAILSRTLIALAAIGALPAAIVAVWGPELFAFVLGDQWTRAGEFARFLAPMIFTIFVSSPTSSTFLVLGLQRLSLTWGIAMLVYRPAAIWLGAQIGGIFSALALLAAVEIISILLYQRAAFRRI